MGVGGWAWGSPRGEKGGSTAWKSGTFGTFECAGRHPWQELGGSHSERPSCFRDRNVREEEGPQRLAKQNYGVTWVGWSSSDQGSLCLSPYDLTGAALNTLHVSTDSIMTTIGRFGRHPHFTEGPETQEDEASCPRSLSLWGAELDLSPLSYQPCCRKSNRDPPWRSHPGKIGPVARQSPLLASHSVPGTGPLWEQGNG